MAMVVNLLLNRCGTQPNRMTSRWTLQLGKVVAPAGASASALWNLPHSVHQLVRHRFDSWNFNWGRSTTMNQFGQITITNYYYYCSLHLNVERCFPSMWVRASVWCMVVFHFGRFNCSRSSVRSVFHLKVLSFVFKTGFKSDRSLLLCQTRTHCMHTEWWKVKMCCCGRLVCFRPDASD